MNLVCHGRSLAAICAAYSHTPPDKDKIKNYKNHYRHPYPLPHWPPPLLKPRSQANAAACVEEHETPQLSADKKRRCQASHFHSGSPGYCDSRAWPMPSKQICGSDPWQQRGLKKLCVPGSVTRGCNLYYIGAKWYNDNVIPQRRRWHPPHHPAATTSASTGRQ